MYIEIVGGDVRGAVPAAREDLGAGWQGSGKARGVATGTGGSGDSARRPRLRLWSGRAAGQQGPANEARGELGGYSRGHACLLSRGFRQAALLHRVLAGRSVQVSRAPRIPRQS